MTREEFSRLFAATSENTNGWSDKALSRVNEIVYEKVKELDVFNSATKSVVDWEFERAWNLLEEEGEC